MESQLNFRGHVQNGKELNEKGKELNEKGKELNEKGKELIGRKRKGYGIAGPALIFSPKSKGVRN
jgi:hypothetical protein